MKRVRMNGFRVVEGKRVFEKTVVLFENEMAAYFRQNFEFCSLPVIQITSP